MRLEDMNVNLQGPFEVGQKVVSSSHGVGEIQGVEVNNYGDTQVSCYVINLINQKMSIKIPINKAIDCGLRPLTNAGDIQEVYQVLKTKSNMSTYKSKVKKFTDYKQKLNSGNIIDLATVVRDLHKPDTINSSYSQKSIYDSALTRLANELALLEGLKLNEMLANLEELLIAKGSDA